MRRLIIVVLSLFLVTSIYFSYDSLNNKQEEIINEETSGIDNKYISYTLNGSSTELSYDTLTSDYDVNSITCENGSTAVWNDTDKSIKFSNIQVPDYCTIDFKEKPPTLAKAILRDNPTISERTDFSVTNVANTTGTIYKTTSTEDGSTVYYYSGNTTNNWVKFGGFYWRIIRTNEDGSVRLLYAGTSHDTIEGYIGSSAFNSTYNESRYVGYMYGGNTSLADNRTNIYNSDIKKVIDTWYQNNLLTDYDKYTSKSAIYCNDRSVGSGTWVNTKGKFYYGAYTRLITNKTPTYKCGGNTSGGLFESTQAVEDKFSASTTGGGNGQLTYPAALMTADEVLFAGGPIYEVLSSPYAYYYTNSAESSITGSTEWWLLSPFLWKFGGGSDAFVIFGSGSPGRLGDSSYLSSIYGVRPVVSLAFCAQVTGTGTASDPYEVITNENSCE